jgi:hypothetical protein
MMVSQGARIQQKVFPVHIPTILHGMLVGAAGLLWL